MSKLSKETKAVLWGSPFGRVWPPRDNPPPPAGDGRTAALRTLARYLSDLTFFRAGGKTPNGEQCPPIEMKIPKERIFIEWPDDEGELQFPSLALLAQADADYDSIGLVSNTEEWSQDVYAPGTMLVTMGEYVENISLEVWAETKAQRRGCIAGIEAALSPTEQMSGLRFRMPDYYEQLCCFSIQSRAIIDDEDAVRIRRRARFTIQLRFNNVALVNSTPFEANALVGIDGADDDGAPLPIESDDEPGESKCPDSDC